MEFSDADREVYSATELARRAFSAARYEADVREAQNRQ